MILINSGSNPIRIGDMICCKGMPCVVDKSDFDIFKDNKSGAFLAKTFLSEPKKPKQEKPKK